MGNKPPHLQATGLQIFPNNELEADKSRGAGGVGLVCRWVEALALARAVGARSRWRRCCWGSVEANPRCVVAIGVWVASQSLDSSWPACAEKYWRFGGKSKFAAYSEKSRLLRESISGHI